MPWYIFRYSFVLFSFIFGLGHPYPWLCRDKSYIFYVCDSFCSSSMACFPYFFLLFVIFSLFCCISFQTVEIWLYHIEEWMIIILSNCYKSSWTIFFDARKQDFSCMPGDFLLDFSCIQEEFLLDNNMVHMLYGIKMSNDR